MCTWDPPWGSHIKGVETSWSPVTVPKTTHYEEMYMQWTMMDDRRGHVNFVSSFHTIVTIFINCMIGIISFIVSIMIKEFLKILFEYRNNLLILNNLFNDIDMIMIKVVFFDILK